MIQSLSRRLSTNRDLVVNSTALIGTTAVTSGLGFVFWWLAAHLYPPTAIGLASAAVSAMLLLGSVSTLGLGTLLMGALPRSGPRPGTLMATSLLVVSCTSACIGVGTSLLLPRLSPELSPLSQSAGTVILFTVGVVLTGVTMVLDQACIGLLLGGLQLRRNGVLAVAKLAAVGIAAALGLERSGLAIYGAWALGAGLSLAVVAIGLRGRTPRPSGAWIQWRLLTRLRNTTLAHYGLDVALQAPGYVLPVVVTAQISAEASASFYTAWMLAGLLFVVPNALTAVLYSLGSAAPAELFAKARFTTRVSLAVGLFGVLVAAVAGETVLRAFGDAYARQGLWVLRVLVLAVFPITARAHYVATCRVGGTMAKAAPYVAAGALLEVALAVVGASLAGLTGLALGWVAAVYAEGAVSVPLTRRALRAVALSSHRVVVDATSS